MPHDINGMIDLFNQNNVVSDHYIYPNEGHIVGPLMETECGSGYDPVSLYSGDVVGDHPHIVGPLMETESGSGYDPVSLYSGDVVGDQPHIVGPLMGEPIEDPIDISHPGTEVLEDIGGIRNDPVDYEVVEVIRNDCDDPVDSEVVEVIRNDCDDPVDSEVVEEISDTPIASGNSVEIDAIKLGLSVGRIEGLINSVKNKEN
jgi:hypothetical protein